METCRFAARLEHITLTKIKVFPISKQQNGTTQNMDRSIHGQVDVQKAL
jgi:hypothetical protein